MTELDSSTLAGQWSRGRLALVVAAVVGVAALLVAGLAVTVIGALTDDPASPQVVDEQARFSAGPDGIRGEEYRDTVAAAPMLASTADDMQPAAPALNPVEALRIPAAARVGAEQVPSGFPQTPEGAVAQLAAIEATVLTPMSVEFARQVFEAWSLPGAQFERWPAAASISSFHAAAGTVDGDGSVSISVAPVGAQVKGTDGPGWVLACVQLDVQASVVERVRFGYGHCDRMTWVDGRWVIDSGVPPAIAPSTWPGSERSREAGWLAWREAGEGGA